MVDDSITADKSAVTSQEDPTLGKDKPEGGPSGPVVIGQSETTTSSNKKRKRKKKKKTTNTIAGEFKGDNGENDDGEGDEVEEQILLESEVPSRDEVGDVSFAVGPGTDGEEEPALQELTTAAVVVPEETTENSTSIEEKDLNPEAIHEATGAGLEGTVSEQKPQETEDDNIAAPTLPPSTSTDPSSPPKVDGLVTESSPANPVGAAFDTVTAAEDVTGDEDSAGAGAGDEHEDSAEDKSPIQSQKGNDLKDQEDLDAIFTDHGDHGDIFSHLSQPEPEQSSTTIPKTDDTSDSLLSQPTKLDALFADETQQPEDAFAQLVVPTSSSEVAEQSLATEPVETEPSAPLQRTLKPPKLESLFSDQEDGADAFAQIVPSETEPSSLLRTDTPTSAQAPGPQEPTSVKLDTLFSDDIEGGDVFAQLGGAQDAAHAASAEESVVEHQAASEPSPSSVSAPAAITLDEKDFSDLLAEFEGELAGQPETAAFDPAPGSTHADPNASTADLFGDDATPSAFDDILASTSSAAESDAPEVKASDKVSSNSMSSLNGEGQATNGNEPLPFEVPQGWYDEAGEWQWYTEEERELVRLTMMDEAGLEKSEAKQSVLSTTQSYYAPPVSENAARRTPQPESVPQMSQSTYDPYAPTAAQTKSINPYTPSTTASFVPTPASFIPTPSPFAAQSSQSVSAQPSPYAPTTASSYDPYAPSTSTSSSSPYNAVPKPYGGVSAPSTASRVPPVQEDRPAPPKRVVSNAYDPPFLRPQKSFIRPASAAATAPLSFTPTPPAAVAPPQPAPPAPPPGGPPRRSKTPSAAAAPAFAPPPPRLPTPTFAAPPPPQPVEDVPQPPHKATSPVPDPYAPADPYASRTSQPAAPIAPPATAAALTPATPPQSRLPPRTPTYNSFDPPLRPTSAGRARAAAPERTNTPPAASLAPPSAPPPAGPPRGPSRGSVRKPSLMFEDRPLVDRPSSRTGGPASVHGKSPVAMQTDLPPPRPVSRQALEPAQTPRYPVQPSPATPIVQDAIGGEEYDPEGGEGIEHRAWSPEPRSSFEDRSDQSRQLQQPQPSAVDLEVPDVATAEEEHESNQPDPSLNDQLHGNSSYEPYASSQKAAYSVPPEQSPKKESRSAPPQQQYAPSSYDPSPQQSAYAPPPMPAQPTTQTYQRPAPSAYQQYQPSQPASHDSLGLGLQPMGSPPRSEPQDIYNPYAPSAQQTQTSYAPPEARAEQRQNSYTSYAPAGLPTHKPAEYQPVETTQPGAVYDPYGPSPQAKTLSPPQGQYRAPLASSYGSDMGTSPPQPNYFQSMPPPDPTYVPQQVLEQKPVNEDPLGRSTLAARNAPLAVFGFGGVLITAFPGSADAEGDVPTGHARKPSYGYASGRGQLWIRTVSDLASSSALKPNDNVFPGPLVHDPATPKGAAGEKKKKEAVTAYLSARAEEIEKGLPYLKTSASQARREEEGKLVLVRLLAALVSGEGKMTGKPETEEAVRNALGNIPSINGASSFGSTSLMSPMKASASDSTSTRASPSSLKDISDLLSRGEKREAAQYAASRGLWSHALLISSSADPELWSEIVMRFTEAELASHPDAAALKASYAIFSGRVATSVDELVSAAGLASDASKDQWREVIAAVVFNGKPADLACLDELGSRLRKAGLNYPAHVCHLLSPTSAFGDMTPAAFERTIALTQNPRDEDAIVFAEIAEYARSLVSLPKGQELPFVGLPQLLPYKLQRAWLAAELGDVEQAKRYCTAIETAAKPSKNAPSALAGPLLASLEDLHERLTGTPSINPAGSLGAGRKAKGTAGIGSWIEGRLTKFIAGEEGETTATKPTAATSKKDTKTDGHIGPFSHFSTIAPAASDAISRNPSTADLDVAAGAPDFRCPSPLSSQSHWQGEQSYVDQTYGEQQGATSGSAWGGWGSTEVPEQDDATPTDAAADEEGEFINPMAAMSMGSLGNAPSDYNPPKAPARNDFEDEDEDDDLGIGNSSLSRGRTPKPAPDAAAGKGEAKSTKEDKAQPAARPEPPKPEQKGSWLGRWWTKKEGEGGGPIRAKLGEESSMVYDKELKRWVVKGAKPEPVAATPPPPPRAQTVSPAAATRPEASARAMSATPPPSQFNSPPGAARSRTSAPPAGFSEVDGQIRRNKSSLSESITADGPAPMSSIAPPAAAALTGSAAAGPPGPSGPPTASGGPPKPISRPATASIDDLLSRPPSKRPGSSARKPMKNRYVDVFQPAGGES